MASAQLFAAVPFYADLTLDALGGKGVRWPETTAAAAFGDVELGPFTAEVPPEPAVANGRLRLGTFRSLWSAPEVAASPSLRFLERRLHVEMAPADAQRLDVFDGEHVVVEHDATALDAIVALRAATPEGTVFVESTALDGPLVEVRKVT